MAEVFFFDQEGQPLPKDEVRIEELRAEPYPDRERIKVSITLTPFLDRPNLSVGMRNLFGEMVASIEVLEVMSVRTEVTLHLRGSQVQDEHIVRVDLYYEGLDTIDSKETRVGETSELSE